jgi:hypothetical protein
MALGASVRIQFKWGAVVSIGGCLDQGALGDQRRDPLVHVGREVALGVGD